MDTNGGILLHGKEGYQDQEWVLKDEKYLTETTAYFLHILSS